MRNAMHFFIILFLFSCCLTYPGQGHTQTADVVRFVNNTGKTVTDLHVTFYKKGVEMKEHNFPKVPGGGNIIYREPARNDSETRHDFRNGALPNKGIVTIHFDSDSVKDMRIKEWYWTVNDIPLDTLAGTDADGKGLDPNIVGPEDVVSELKLRPNVKDRRGKEQKVNDLHIVTKKRPTILNDTRDDANADTKAGGVFTGKEVVSCDCERVNAANNRASRAGIPKVCFAVCKGQTDTLYVLQLDDVVAPLSSTEEIKLDLKGVAQTDIGWHWWTYDGRPWRKSSRSSAAPSKGSADTGVEEDKGQKNEPTPKADWTNVSYTYPHFGTRDADTYLAVGVQTARYTGPYDDTRNFAQSDIDRLQQSVYENPERFGQIVEAVGGEFFIGSFSEAARFENVKVNPLTSYGLNLAYGCNTHLEIETQISRLQTTAEADFPVLVFSEISGETHSMTGRYALEQKGYQASLGMNYLLGEGPIQALTGAYLGLHRTAETATVTIADVAWSLDNQKSTSFTYGVQLGARYRSAAGFFVDLRLRTASFQTRTQYGVQASVGIQL